MKLWLVRHPRPLIAAGICYGSTDMPADEMDTVRQALMLSVVLPQGVPIRTSPLARCTQLAEALQRVRPDLEPQQDKRLAEMDFGRWEGQRWTEIPKAEYDGWMADFPGYKVGGAETVRGFMSRVDDALGDLNGETEAVWITHAGVIRAAGLLASGVREVTRAAQWPREAPPCGQWLELWL